MSEELTEAKGLHERLADVQVVDVREPFEWDAGHIEGSHHVPLGQLLAGAAPELDPERPVVVVCRMGNRSEVGALMLGARGHQAHNLEGGLLAWEKAGYELVTDDGSPATVA